FELPITAVSMPGANTSGAAEVTRLGARLAGSESSGASGRTLGTSGTATRGTRNAARGSASAHASPGGAARWRKAVAGARNAATMQSTSARRTVAFQVVSRTNRIAVKASVSMSASLLACLVDHSGDARELFRGDSRAGDLEKRGDGFLGRAFEKCLEHATHRG